MPSRLLALRAGWESNTDTGMFSLAGFGCEACGVARTSSIEDGGLLGCVPIERTQPDGEGPASPLFGKAVREVEDEVDTPLAADDPEACMLGRKGAVLWLLDGAPGCGTATAASALNVGATNGLMNAASLCTSFALMKVGVGPT